HHMVFPDRPGELLLVLDAVLERQHRRAVTHQRPQPGGGGIGVEGLDTEQHKVARADVSRVVGGRSPHLEVALDAADSQSPLAKGPQVGAPRDEMHLRTGLGEPAAEVAADAARPVYSDTNASPPSGPGPLQERRPGGGSRLGYPAGAGADGSFCQRPNSFPCGSLAVTNQPMPGTGAGWSTSPPSSLTRAAPALMSSTAK